MYLVFTRMPGDSYRRRLRSLLLYLCYVFRALINSLVCWFCTNALALFCFWVLIELSFSSCLASSFFFLVWCGHTFQRPYPQNTLIYSYFGQNLLAMVLPNKMLLPLLWSSSMLLYAHNDRKDCSGLGAPNDHLDFHTAPELQAIATSRSISGSSHAVWEALDPLWAHIRSLEGYHPKKTLRHCQVVLKMFSDAFSW